MEEDDWDDALLSEITALETQHLKTRRDQNQGQKPFVSSTVSIAASSSSSSVWNCRSCTLQNDGSRATCLVCTTPRTAATVTDSSKKLQQATLSFNHPLAPVRTSLSREHEQSIECMELSRFNGRMNKMTAKKSQQTTIASALGQLVTSRHSGSDPVAAIATTATISTSPLLQVSRHATGEDYHAKKRYLEIEPSMTVPDIDNEAAQYFVYPTNYSIREYQLAIAEKALYHNTLVSLPTGLGKTLVAAVVMYNFYRWFPTGKIVFMAPTKPLVAQQIKACHEIMGIPLSDTAELQGNVPPALRRMLWRSKRVFFCTPQSLQNDLKRGVCAAEEFVCIVVDEAHRATGNYAYCCVVQEIEAKTKFFRVLALSATPGAKFDVIQDVVTNLRISHIESRSTDDLDVKKYTHTRQEEVVVCRLSAQIMEVKAQLLKCFMPIVQRLFRGNIIEYGDPEKLTSWYVLQAREKFRKSPIYASHRSAESDLALLVSLLHAKSLLIGHGLSSFCDQITNWIEERKKGKMSWSKKKMLHSSDFQSLELSVTLSASSSNAVSHPKLVKLREVLLEHFQRHAAGKSSTRAIVFTQYRASVSEIVALLRPLAPLLNVQPFIGQGASGKAKENKGQSQKVQQEIVRRFRLGEFNVLVATCIAEEGLDIGEVDLIVSFDALTSPVRMIQRMGRTGRKRVGRVIILVTEGDEQKKLARSASAAKTVSRALTTFKSKFAYSQCPRMLPTGICPQLRELKMKIPTFHASQVGGKSASGTVDPSLWQLSDAERAVALTKYSPSNFMASSRNKLCPIVANRTLLLRRQPRSLVRKSLGTRVGYSSRSMMLVALVREIHNIKEVLETESDDDDVKSDDNKNESGAAISSRFALSGITDKVTCCRLPSLNTMGTKRAGSDSKTGSPWRFVSSHSELDSDGRCDGSFASMDDSMTSFDLHFSPQVVNLATQDASADDAGQPKSTIAHSGEDQFSASMTNVHRMSLSISGLERPASAPTHTSEINVDNLCRVSNVPDEQCINLDDVDSKERSQQTSLTLASDPPRPPSSLCEDSYLQMPVGPNATLTTDVLVAPRSRSIRQLHFDKDEVDGNLSGQTQSAESSLQGVTVLAEDTDKVQEIHKTLQVEDEGHVGFSFALLSPNAYTDETNTEGDIEDTTHDTYQTKDDSSAWSAALVSPSHVGNKTTSNDRISAKLADVTLRDREYEPVDDGTDGDDVDDVNEVNRDVKDEPICTTDRGRSVVDIAEKDECRTTVTREEKLASQEPALVVQPCASGTNGVTPMTVESQLKRIEPEQVEEDSCSICLECESFDDDPIVFCDGCNVAVHQFCYGINVVPSDKWFCDICAGTQSSECAAKSNQYVCQLCPLRGGAFKQTKCGKWVHVQCFLWIPELRVEKDDDNVFILGELGRLDPDRKTLDCSLCHSRKGNGIIQCAHKNCLAAFHVSCAAFAHYRMCQLDFSDGNDTECRAYFMMYCPLHRNSSAPIVLCEQQTTLSSIKARSPKGSAPTATKASSPSCLLTSPPSAEAKKKAKTFRRLKRKHDATQSQKCLQSETSETLSTASPWQKRITRSKRRRHTSRVFAAAYIEDIADVRGGANSDDDDEDDYGDDYKEAVDDAFINDSSQLLYSQSVVSPDSAGYDNSKKKRKKSSPDMRAIYARSLFESQNSPLLLRRGGRQLGALPYDGIIRACLSELHSEANAEASLSARRRSCPQVAQKEDVLVTSSTSSTPISATTAVTECDDDVSSAEAEPLPSFDLFGTTRPPLAGVANAHLMNANGPSVAQPGHASPVDRAQDTCDAELHKKSEANRMKALIKLKGRRQTKTQQPAHLARLQDAVVLPSHSSMKLPLHKVAERSCASFTATTIKKTHEHEMTATSSQQLSTPSTPCVTSTKDLTSMKPMRPGPIQQSQRSWIIFVSSSFASTREYPIFLSSKHTKCSVVIDSTLETDGLLSVRTAVLFLTGKQLHDLAPPSAAPNIVKTRGIWTLVTMHKKVVVAVVGDGGCNAAEILRLRQLAHVTVIVQPHYDSLCAELHQLAHQEFVEGYELPSPSLCHPGFSNEICRGIDADFASRLAFFRTIHPLSLDSALSLSFRFKNFAARQVPVLKFKEMHWQRMLPWISESKAKEIQKYVTQHGAVFNSITMK